MLYYFDSMSSAPLGFTNTSLAFFFLMDRTWLVMQLMSIFATVSLLPAFLLHWSSLSFSLYIGSPYYDSLGSLGVGTLLGTVSAFLIYTNTEALLGRSIKAEHVQKLTELLENDPVVRSVLCPLHGSSVYLQSAGEELNPQTSCHLTDHNSIINSAWNGSCNSLLFTIVTFICVKWLFEQEKK